MKTSNVVAFPAAKDTAPKKEKKRRKGERSDGLIQVTFSRGVDENGKRRQWSFYGKTRAEAEAKRDAFRKKLISGVSAEDIEITVSQWCDRWMATYKYDLEERNAANYASHIKHIKACIGGMQVAHVTENNLLDIFKTMKGKSESSYSKMQFILKGIFHTAHKNHLCADDPSEEIKPPKGTSGTHRALEPNEVKLITENYARSRFGLAAMMMMYTGIRRGELIALRWENIDMEKKNISITQSASLYRNRTTIKDGAKTKAGVRKIPVCNLLFSALETVPESERRGQVFTNVSGGILTEQGFERAWETLHTTMERIQNGFDVETDTHMISKKRALQKAAKWLEFNVRPHDLRHTFATALYDAGVDVKTAQYYLGHSDIRTTLELYTHLSQERENISRAAMVDFLDGWIAKNQPEKKNFPMLPRAKIVGKKINASKMLVKKL